MTFRPISHALLAATFACGLTTFSSLHADETADKPAKTPEATKAKRIAALEKSLSHATLVGHFTITGQKGEGPAEDRYDLGEVKHLDKDQWSIQVRIRYGEHDVQVPITVPIRWAEDTPVISVDDLAIPGLGTYTARVMFYHDHYAGFWTGHDHGGHLYGLVEHGKPEATEKKSAAPKK